jgi:hypothetical protein
LNISYPIIIKFPEEEYLKLYKAVPNSFDISFALSEAVKNLCFWFVASKIFPEIINIHFNHSEFKFIYLLSEFEINQYPKNILNLEKLNLIKKKYQILLNVKDIIHGKLNLNIKIIDYKTLEIIAKLEINENLIKKPNDFESFDDYRNFMLMFFEVLHKSIWTRLSSLMNKISKTQKLRLSALSPEYLKTSTASFIQELKRIMISNKSLDSFKINKPFAQKYTKSGVFSFELGSIKQLETLDGYDNELINLMREKITEKILKADDLTVDVLNGIIHIWLQRHKDPDEPVLISADELLFIRGIKFKGGYKEFQKKEISRNIEILSDFKIQITGFLKGSTIEKSEIESPIIKADKILENSYFIIPGEVLRLSMIGSGSQIGLIHRKIAEYHSHNYLWEKRIGNYLSWIWRIRQNKADYLVPLTVGSLIKEINIECSKRPNRTRERLEKALDKLQKDGIIKTWQYETIEEELLSRRNWLETWLELKLLIEPPLKIAEQYSKISNSKKKKQACNFDKIKELIKIKNLSITLLSEKIGIMPDLLNKILEGKIKPTSYQVEKLEKFIESYFTQ